MPLYETQVADTFCFVTVESSVAKRKAPCKTKSSRSHVMKLARHRAKTDPNAKWYKSAADQSTDASGRAGKYETHQPNSHHSSQRSSKEQLARRYQASENFEDQQSWLSCCPRHGLAGDEQEEEAIICNLASLSCFPRIHHERPRAIKKNHSTLSPVINLTDAERYMHCGLHLCKLPEFYMGNQFSRSYCNYASSLLQPC